MTLELASIPLAALAGALSILSPCVWPLVPVVMASAATSGRKGVLFLALGLSTSFAVAGTLLSFALISLGLDPELFRYIAAVLLVLVGLILVIKRLNNWLSYRLSQLTSNVDISRKNPTSNLGQFSMGALLGLVWLPCVGPTLGAAIALASMGQSFSMAFLVMFVFGLSTALVLVVTGILSSKVINKVRPGVLQNVERLKFLLGLLLIVLGLMVLIGIDKMLETLALQMLPDWAISL